MRENAKIVCIMSKTARAFFPLDDSLPSNVKLPDRFKTTYVESRVWTGMCMYDPDKFSAEDVRKIISNSSVRVQ